MTWEAQEWHHWVPLPDCDENGTPLEKMPNCPRCDADELGMLMPGAAFCYFCHLWIRNDGWIQNDHR